MNTTILRGVYGGFGDRRTTRAASAQKHGPVKRYGEVMKIYPPSMADGKRGEEDRGLGCNFFLLFLFCCLWVFGFWLLEGGVIIYMEALVSMENSGG